MSFRNLLLSFLALAVLALPFSLSAAQLSEDDLAKKREGYYPVGLPLINFSSDTGVGLGARVYLYNNGSKSDEYWSQTPYMMQLYMQGFYTTGGMQYHEINLDMPFFMGSKFRLRTALVYDANANANFFGDGDTRSKLQGFVSPYLGSTGGATGTYSAAEVIGNSKQYDKYSDFYKEFLDKKYTDYNPYSGKYEEMSLRKYYNYTRKKPTYWLNMYYNVTDWFKLMGGVQFMYVDIDAWGYRKFSDAAIGGNDLVSAPTLLDQFTKETLIGRDGGWTNYATFGAAIDTRDFEPNPKKGILLEYTVEVAGKALGSDYTYHRQNASLSVYYTLWRLTFAGRGAYTDANEETPFYQLGSYNLFFNNHAGIGGIRTNAGYKEQRFVDYTMTSGQAELRFFVGDTMLGSQRFGLQLVGFADTGNTYQNANDVYDEPRWENYVTSFGGGVAIPWNLNTIIHVLAGFSSEDMGISIDFNHRF